MKRTLMQFFAVAALGGALALPALAQETPEQTNLDPAAARIEMRNARDGQLTAVSPEQAHANALKRCDRLPDFYKEDCISRVNGGGQVSGSVIGGGQFKESVTTMPADELAEQLQRSQAIQLPAPSSPASAD